ncbi:MAG: pgpB [Bacilli bacterium]|nr:pgpB [Bacilli bacterium]
MRGTYDMNLKLQLTRTFILSLLSAVGFGVVAILVGEHNMVRFDQAIASYVQSFESPPLTLVMQVFTTIGSTPVVIILSILSLFVLYKVLHYRMELILFIAVVVGSAVLNQVLKALFRRARPTVHRLAEASGYSFPSGHSMEAFALYGVLAFLLWRHLRTRLARTVLLVVSVVLIAAIGLSRIYLGVHYPSDVLAGYLASGFWLAAGIWVYQRYQENRYLKSNQQRG